MYSLTLASRRTMRIFRSVLSSSITSMMMSLLMITFYLWVNAKFSNIFLI